MALDFLADCTRDSFELVVGRGPLGLLLRDCYTEAAYSTTLLLPSGILFAGVVVVLVGGFGANVDFLVGDLLIGFAVAGVF